MKIAMKPRLSVPTSQASDHQLNFILTALNYSNLYDISKVTSLTEIDSA